MMDEATYQKCIEAFKNATYGDEVRIPMISCFQQIHEENKTYDQVKKEILSAKTQVDKQVASFDAKVTDAKTATSLLETAISNGNIAKTNLTKATDTANTAKDNLVNATSAGDMARGKLETATNNANIAKTNAEKAQANLQGVIDNSVTRKNELQLVIDSANTINNTLTETSRTASIANTNLTNAINSASLAKGQLEDVIQTASAIKVELSRTMLQAQSVNDTLNGTIGTGRNLKQELDMSNTFANSNIGELRSENFNSQEILTGVADLRAYLGLSDDDILGVQVDYKNKAFKRIAGATSLLGGVDFDKFSMFGGRKRCNVADNGTINCYFGEAGYTEDGSNGQVMVYQPKFYYLVCPVVYDKIETGIGYHLRKANYYVSEKPRAGFKLHPAFYDRLGNRVNYILLSAYEGSIFDTSAGAYILDDAQVITPTTDKFCSIAGAKPASGKTQDLTRPNVEQMAQNRGECWHGDLIKATSANQLLMIIEMGMMNMQTAIGLGVVSVADNPNTENNSKNTGGTSTLGNGTGQATGTSGQVSITYRGMENPWGNIYKFVYGVNIHGNGSQSGGIPYVCNDFMFAESKNSGNYESAGFTLSNTNGYISAMGYSQTHDWLFMASECLGNSAVPVGDYQYVTPNLNGYRIALLGGSWAHGGSAGAFYWALSNGVGHRSRSVGGRLVYVPLSVI